MEIVSPWVRIFNLVPSHEEMYPGDILSITKLSDAYIK
jgi:hypothetical protein